MIALMAQKTGSSARKVCAVLGEVRSSFYHAAKPTKTQLGDAQMGDFIESVFRCHRRRDTVIAAWSLNSTITT